MMLAYAAEQVAGERNAATLLSRRFLEASLRHQRLK